MIQYVLTWDDDIMLLGFFSRMVSVTSINKSQIYLSTCGYVFTEYVKIYKNSGLQSVY